MGHPFFDASTFPWHHPDAVPAQRALLTAYPQFDSIDTLYRRCAPGLRPLSMYGRPDALWKDALEALVAAGALRRLCELVLEDRVAAAAHGAIRRLVDATDSSAAQSSVPRERLQSLVWEMVDLPDLKDAPASQPPLPPLRQLSRGEVETRRSYLSELKNQINRWIDNSIHHAPFIDLEIADEPMATRLPWGYKDARSSQEFADIEEAFTVYQRRLLLLGGPGSGKSSTLWHLAQFVLCEARASHDAPIPLVVNLTKFRFDPPRTSTGFLWRLFNGPPPESDEDDRRIEAWLAAELAERTGLKRKRARTWLQEGRVAVFLDGLDEVNDERRAELAVLLNRTFLRRHRHIPVVVCSRIDEYTPIKEREDAKLQLRGAVVLQPLTPAQINDYLEAARATGLRDTLGQNAMLSELARTPLTLSMMTLAYGLRGASKIPVDLSLAEARHRLFESYVDGMLQRKEWRDRQPADPLQQGPESSQVSESAYRYSPKRVKRTLGWLASRLSIRAQTACSWNRCFSMLAESGDIDPSRTPAWVVQVTRTIVLALLIAIVGTILAPLDLSGVRMILMALVSSCGVQLITFLVRRWRRLPVIPEETWPGVASTVAILWVPPTTTSFIALSGIGEPSTVGVLILTGLAACCAIPFALRKGGAWLWLLTVGWLLGLLAGAVIAMVHATGYSLSITLAAGSLGGLAIGGTVYHYRKLAGNRSAGWGAFAAVLVVGVPLFVLFVYSIDKTSAALWADPLYQFSSIGGLFPFVLPRPWLPILGWGATTAIGGAAGGPNVATLAGASWGLALWFVALFAPLSPWLRTRIDRALNLVERTVERTILSPIAALLLSVTRTLPWRPRTFLTYCGDALLLKPFRGEIEFVHRRLREHFALRRLFEDLPRRPDERPDATSRADVIEALGFQGVAAIEMLSDLLREGTVPIQVAAINALGRISAPEVSRHLRWAFDNGDPSVREAVIGNLRQLSESDRNPILGKAARSEDVSIVKAVINAIDNDEARWAATLRILVIRVLANEEQARDLVRHVCLKANDTLAEMVGESLPRSARPLIKALAADPEPIVRYRACIWMATHKHLVDLDALLTLRDDRYPEIREVAAAAMAVVDDPRAIEALFDALRDKKAEVRAAAVTALSGRKDTRLEDPLLRALADRNPAVRQAAASALGEMSADIALDPLLRATTDRHAHTRAAAIESLGQLGDARALHRILDASLDKDLDVRNAAVTALGKFDDDRARSVLLEALADPNPNIRAGAANALQGIADQGAAEALMAALSDPAPAVRAAAAAALGQYGAKAVTGSAGTAPRELDTWVRTAVIEPMLGLLGDDSLEVRATALDALHLLEDPSIDDDIATATLDMLTRLEEERDDMADSSVIALFEVVFRGLALAIARDGSEVYRITLTSYLTDEHPTLRRAALEALASHRDECTKALLTDDCNGLRPWIDPRMLITAERVSEAAGLVELTTDEVRSMYEALAPEFLLLLEWLGSPTRCSGT